MPPCRLRSRLLAWALRSRAASGRLQRFRATIGHPMGCRARSARSEAQSWRNIARQPLRCPNAAQERIGCSNVARRPPASTHCPATPSAPEQSHLKRDRGTDVHASFGNFFFAHRQTPRHQRSKTPGLHEGIMRLPAPDQIDIPITGTNASQALGALEDCPPPIDILELIRRKRERDREALTLHRIGQDPNAHLVAQPFYQVKTDSR